MNLKRRRKVGCQLCKWWKKLRHGQDATCETLHKINCENYGRTDADIADAGLYCPIFKEARA